MHFVGLNVFTFDIDYPYLLVVVLRYAEIISEYPTIRIVYVSYAEVEVLSILES